MSDPEAQRLLAEASLTGFELIRCMLENMENSDGVSTEEVAERVLRYEAEVLAAAGQSGTYEVAVSPAQVLLYAQLAGCAAMTFTAMCQRREGRTMTPQELSAELSRYQEMLQLGGSL